MWRHIGRDYVIQSTERESRMKKSEQCLREMWDAFKHINIYVVGIPGEEKRVEKYSKE